MRLSAPSVPIEGGRPAAQPAVQATTQVARPEDARPAVYRAVWLRHLPVVAAATLVMAVAAIVTGANLFGAPHYESDEGTYVASAWSMFEEGKLAYYTYNYDHPPLGWFVIGLWAKLVGGFLAFGTSIDTARVLMLLVASASTLLIFLIVRAATGRLIAAVSAGV